MVRFQCAMEAAVSGDLPVCPQAAVASDCASDERPPRPMPSDGKSQCSATVMVD
jgi:hypothetical protein